MGMPKKPKAKRCLPSKNKSGTSKPTATTKQKPNGMPQKPKNKKVVSGSKKQTRYSKR